MCHVKQNIFPRGSDELVVPSHNQNNTDIFSVSLHLNATWRRDLRKKIAKNGKWTDAAGKTALSVRVSVPAEHHRAAVWKWLFWTAARCSSRVWKLCVWSRALLHQFFWGCFWVCIKLWYYWRDFCSSNLLTSSHCLQLARRSSPWSSSVFFSAQHGGSRARTSSLARDEICWNLQYPRKKWTLMTNIAAPSRWQAAWHHTFLHSLRNKFQKWVCLSFSTKQDKITELTVSPISTPRGKHRVER